MKIAYLGAGTWGYSLAVLLASKGYDLTLWGRDASFLEKITKLGRHPKLSEDVGTHVMPKLTSSLEEAVLGADIIVESVTSSGVREVFKNISLFHEVNVPVVLTSKGIEQGTGLFLSEVISDVLGKDWKNQIAYLSGPSHAEEVIKGLPSSVVAAAYEPSLMAHVSSMFTTPKFRVYPNQDVRGVALGGALKNVVAIACGISDGLGFGDNTKAALMTRGLHEITKLGLALGCSEKTFMGLSGMGDLSVTCWSEHGRNVRFGRYLGQGMSIEEAKSTIGMAVEGLYTCVSAHEIGKNLNIPMPILEIVYQITQKGMPAKDAVEMLMSRRIKEEHL